MGDGGDPWIVCWPGRDDRTASDTAASEHLYVYAGWLAGEEASSSSGEWKATRAEVPQDRETINSAAMKWSW